MFVTFAITLESSGNRTWLKISKEVSKQYEYRHEK